MGTSPGQITIRELLRDEEYKKYFLTVPKLPAHYKGSKPWKLYILLKGSKVWKTKRFETYGDAVRAFKKLAPKMEDAAINCPALGFRPPIKPVKLKGKFDIVRGKKQVALRSRIWHPKLEADHERHEWCPYCRRPTVFKVLVARVRALHGSDMLSEPRYRCTICSASDVIVNLKNPEKEQAWDTNRAQLHEIYKK